MQLVFISDGPSVLRHFKTKVYCRSLDKIAFRHTKGMFSFKKEHKIKENVAFWYPILHFIVYYV